MAALRGSPGHTAKRSAHVRRRAFGPDFSPPGAFAPLRGANAAGSRDGCRDLPWKPFRAGSVFGQDGWMDQSARILGSAAFGGCHGKVVPWQPMAAALSLAAVGGNSGLSRLCRQQAQPTVAKLAALASVVAGMRLGGRVSPAGPNSRQSRRTCRSAMARHTERSGRPYGPGDKLIGICALANLFTGLFS